jgi:hypothetical protein
VPYIVYPTEEKMGFYYSPDPKDFQIRYAEDRTAGGVAAIVSGDQATWAPITGWGVNHQAALEDLVRQMSAKYQEDRDTIRYLFRHPVNEPEAS